MFVVQVLYKSIASIKMRFQLATLLLLRLENMFASVI